MSRAPRTTKKQKELIINLLEENSLLHGGKINPLDVTKLNKVWEHFASELNKIGPAKTIKQWKDVVSEMKTCVRRRARDIKYAHVGTGGGPSVKPLTDLEERVLALISKISIEGVNIVEAGLYVQPELQLNDDHPESETIEISFTDFLENQETSQETVNDEYLITGVDENVQPPIIVEKMRQTRKTRIRPRRLTTRNRTEVAMTTHDEQLKILSQSNFAIAKSIRVLAKSINNLAKK